MVGTFTYDIANNRINMTGGTQSAPITFLDIWNADKAGTLSLQARTGIIGTDANPVALTRNARPTDRVVLGGAKQDLYTVVTAWTNMTSATVRLVGTDTAGNAQTEDLAITGNGTYYATKYFATLTQSQVTVFGGTGSFAYEVKQGQWGVVWKLGTNTFAFDCRLYVGDNSTTTYLTDTNKMITLNKGWWSAGAWMLVRTAATVTFGTVIDATLKHTTDGCSFLYLDDVTPSGFMTSQYAGLGIINLYSCSFYSLAGAYVEIWAGTNVWNCLFTGQTELIVNTSVDAFNLGIEDTKAASPMYGIIAYGANTFNNVIVFGSDRGIRLGSTSATLRNCSLANFNSYALTIVSSAVSHFLIDCTLSAWALLWVSSPTAVVYRQYSFDLKVTDKDNNAINGATVTLTDKDGNQVFSITTDANGSIAKQTVSRGHYNQANGNTLQDYGPHTLAIMKAGYQTYTKKFVLTGKTVWEIKLAKTGSVLLSLGQPVLNLKASDPENLNVLVL